jgi:hypothetical protein
MHNQHEYILLIDSSSAAVKTKLATIGTEWIGKSLKSHAPNWETISNLALARECLGVILTLDINGYKAVAQSRSNPDESIIPDEIVSQLFQAIASKPFLVLAHEALVGGVAIYQHTESASDPEDEDLYSMNPRDFFGDIEEFVRVRTHERLEAWWIEVTSYKRNVEAAELASKFVEDQSSNLLFRLYIPKGQLYEAETSQLLDIFHDWLTSVRKINVRRGGYVTLKGRVVEFHAETREGVQIFHEEIPQFRKFATTISDTKAAEQLLEEYGLSSSQAVSQINEYLKRFKRLQRDTRHKEELAALEIKHQLEEDLGEEFDEVPNEVIMELVQRIIPTSPRFLALGPGGTPSKRASKELNNLFSDRTRRRVEGIVAQHVIGEENLSPAAGELAQHISKLSNEAEKGELLQALRELDDEAAPHPDRVKSGSKLRSFLNTVANNASGVVFGLGQKYLEQQLGL